MLHWKKKQFVQIPRIIQRICSPLCLFSLPKYKQEIFLTFDDGPDPLSTPQTLDLLKRYGAKATFFCSGEQVVRHASLFQRILDEGHAVGNHGYSHANGWKSKCKEYVHNVERCAEEVESRLFRPPYGRISLRQYWALRKKFQVVLWTTLTYDFDPRISVQECFAKTVERTRPGDILVFHDQVKACQTMHGVLEKLLPYFLEKGYQCIPLPR